MNLQEEVDLLRVKVANQAASIHELRTCVDLEKEGAQCTVIHSHDLFFFYFLLELNFVLEEMENRESSEQHLEGAKELMKQVPNTILSSWDSFSSMLPFITTGGLH
jgi:hypothetical protein